MVELILSRQVMVEADRNLTAKLPTLLPEYHDFLHRLSPHVVEDPNRKIVSQAMNVIHHADAPILAAAIAARVDYLITWNTRHFHMRAVREFVPFRVVTPAEFLVDFRLALLDE